MREEDRYNTATVKHKMYGKDTRGLLARSVKWVEMERNSHVADDEMDIYCGNRLSQYPPK